VVRRFGARVDEFATGIVFTLLVSFSRNYLILNLRFRLHSLVLSLLFNI
jgi:hypothetical protein